VFGDEGKAMDEYYVGDVVTVDMTIVEPDGTASDLTLYPVKRINVGGPTSGTPFSLTPSVAGNVLTFTTAPGQLNADGTWSAQFEGLIGGVPYHHADPYTFQVNALVPGG
jgi:hypothetical protein